MNVPAGNSLKLTCPSEGIPLPTIQWYKNYHLMNGTERENGEPVSLLTLFLAIF